MQVYVRVQDAAEADYEWLNDSEETVEADEVQDVRTANELAAGQTLADVENLDALTHLHEPAFVDYLAQRYGVDQVYCRSGAVLIAVNPFKEIEGLYNLQKYHDEMPGWTALPPHVFSIAEGAYRSLRRRLHEPGEARRTRRSSEQSGLSSDQQYKRKRAISGSELMSANPILECFGNARTLRNDNSSRFGKFVRMFFDGHELDASLRMVGTSVETYLLEKVRVVHQNDGERNFHVFYELLAGADDAMKSELHLVNLSAQEFQYINGGQCFQRNDGVRDDKQFQLVLQSMKVLGFTDVERGAIWKILSALLHLGNFKQQLASLLDVVQQTQTHYIRCIKPNDESANNKFDMAKVSSQLRYGGVLKAVEIMRQSFPVRMSHADFVKQYQLLVATSQENSGSVWTAPELIKTLQVSHAELVTESAVKLQSSWRGRQQRRGYVRQLQVLWSIQVRWKAILEKKRRLARRNKAAKVLHRAMRCWVQVIQNRRYQSAILIQRVFRRWHQAHVASLRAAAADEAAAKASREEDKSADPLGYGGRESELTVETLEEDDVLSTATASVGTSAYSEDVELSPLDPVRRAILRGRMNDFGSGSDSENAMLKKALKEVERLRRRAEAAEAALSHFSGQDLRPESSEVLALMTTRTSPADEPAGLSRYTRGASGDSDFSWRQLNTSNLRIDRYGNTVLHQAVDGGNVELACALLVNETSGALEMLQQAETQRGCSPLHLAVRGGNFEMVSLFFRPEVLPHLDLDFSDREGNTALHLATQLQVKFASRVLELLLCFGADANAVNFLKQTPLHLWA
ncbi:Myosin ID heavy chain [Phytophthora ramorum]|uniref:Myosin ID heavy chain n=1 Tax=Phytophthora ramorum TaxID=164328 RepID=UPI0030B37144|nr:Myosin ID heavy chain [Phytophthora ramorum]